MTLHSLVTGASGFVGRWLLDERSASGEQVLGTSTTGRWSSETSGRVRRNSPPRGVDLVAWDFAHGLTPAARARIEEFCPDRIYHLGALSVPADCGDEEPSGLAWQINVEGTRQVLELARSLPRSPRVLFVSSSHVYAPVTSQAPWVDEESPLAPRSGYGKTKLAAEELVRQAWRDDGCEAVIVRAFPHAGPGQNPRMMLAEWIAKFARGDDPVVVQTLSARIDLGDVRDVVRVYGQLIEEGRAGKVYNVGSGQIRTSGEFFECLCRVAGRRPRVVETNPGPKQDPIARIDRVCAATDWTPHSSVEDIVDEAWEWAAPAGWVRASRRDERPKST